MSAPSNTITPFHLAARQGIKPFTKAVRGYNAAKTEYFANIVSISTMHFDVPITTLAHKFKVSTQTVILWIDGKETPPEEVRAKVIRFILKHLKAQLQPKESPNA